MNPWPDKCSICGEVARFNIWYGSYQICRDNCAKKVNLFIKTLWKLEEDAKSGVLVPTSLTIEIKPRSPAYTIASKD